MAACAALLRPLYDLMVARVLQSLWLHTDDTPVKNLGHAPGTHGQGALLDLLRRPRASVQRLRLHRQSQARRTADLPGRLPRLPARRCVQRLRCPVLARSACAGTTPIIEVACNAHARRKFYDARGSDDLRAHQALAYYGQLYELERAATANNFDDEQRRRMRQDLSVPILDKFKTWLEEQRPQVLPKSPMAEAIGYALNNWTALIRYTEAGFLSIDNNVAEREMKRIAIGRKNWLFVGSDKGGRTAAVLFSFTSTCHRLGIEPVGLSAGRADAPAADTGGATGRTAARPLANSPPASRSAGGRAFHRCRSFCRIHSLTIRSIDLRWPPAPRWGSAQLPSSRHAVRRTLTSLVLVRRPGARDLVGGKHGAPGQVVPAPPGPGDGRVLGTIGVGVHRRHARRRRGGRGLWLAPRMGGVGPGAGARAGPLELAAGAQHPGGVRPRTGGGRPGGTSAAAPPEPVPRSGTRCGRPRSGHSAWQLPCLAWYGQRSRCSTRRSSRSTATTSKPFTW